MSRTDAHRPWRVQAADPDVIRRSRQWHHHWVNEFWSDELRRHLVKRSIRCDLWTAGGLGRCSWWPTFNICGCRMCTDQAGRRHGRRKDRHVARNAARAEVKSARAGQ